MTVEWAKRNTLLGFLFGLVLEVESVVTCDMCLVERERHLLCMSLVGAIASKLVSGLGNEQQEEDSSHLTHGNGIRISPQSHYPHTCLDLELWGSKQFKLTLSATATLSYLFHLFYPSKVTFLFSSEQKESHFLVKIVLSGYMSQHYRTGEMSHLQEFKKKIK